MKCNKSKRPWFLLSTDASAWVVWMIADRELVWKDHPSHLSQEKKLAIPQLSHRHTAFGQWGEAVVMRTSAVANFDEEQSWDAELFRWKIVAPMPTNRELNTEIADYGNAWWEYAATNRGRWPLSLFFDNI